MRILQPCSGCKVSLSITMDIEWRNAGGPVGLPVSLATGACPGGVTVRPASSEQAAGARLPCRAEELGAGSQGQCPPLPMSVGRTQLRSDDAGSETQSASSRRSMAASADFISPLSNGLQITGTARSSIGIMERSP